MRATSMLRAAACAPAAAAAWAPLALRLLVVAQLSAVVVSAATSTLYLYVDPAYGSDASSGLSLKAPLQSLNRAQQLAAAAVDQAAATGGVAVTINLLPGTHVVGSTVYIDRPRNTTSSSSITYKTVDFALDRAKVTGSLPIPSACFRPLTPADPNSFLIPGGVQTGVLVCNATAALGVNALADLQLANCERGFNISLPYSCLEMQVYLNGRRLVPPRWPNAEDTTYTKQADYLKDLEKGTVLMSAVVDVGPKVYDASAAPGGAVKLSNATAAQWTRWAKEPALFLSGVLSEPWAWVRQSIAAVDASTGVLRLARGVPYGIKQNAAGVNLMFVDNALSELDDPGEVYVDTKTGLVYLYSPTQSLPPQSTILVTASTAAPLFSLQAATRVTFDNILFDGGRHNLLNVANYSTAVTVRNCEIANFAGTAVYMPHPSVGSAFDNNNIHHLGSTALALYGPEFNASAPPPQPSAASTPAIAVSRSTFSFIGWYNRVYNPAVATEGTSVSITNSRIYSTPHMAVKLCGDGMYFARNEVFSVLWGYRDMGAENYFHDFGGITRYGVYMDDLTSGWTVRNNLFSRIGGVTGNATDGVDVVFSHGGGFNVVAGNVLCRVKGAFRELASFRPGSRCDNTTQFVGNVAVVPANGTGFQFVPPTNVKCPLLVVQRIAKVELQTLPDDSAGDLALLKTLFPFARYGTADSSAALKTTSKRVG
ncbi:pectin lyase fold/virulence factor [Zopfochytrium polystomum]|nr:pectin lyase fold/virulence factor [Zopfochytrium polystomum]